MSFSSMHNDYLDPDRHLWPEEPPEKPKIHWQIRKLVRGLVGCDGVGYFYRSIYKYTDCGPSIGFCIDGRWVYCSDLYAVEQKTWLAEAEKRGLGQGEYANRALTRITDWRFWHDHLLSGISISSIVEGSDAEVPASILDVPCTTDKAFQDWFWQQLEDVNSEACRLWERDNAIHFCLEHPEKGQFFGEQAQFDEVRLDKEEEGEVPEFVLKLAAAAMHDWVYNSEEGPVDLAEGWTLRAYELWD